MTNKIIIISGATGTGKTSTARILTENAPSRLAVHLHTDDFYQYIKRGYIAPWLEEAGDQNETVAEVIAASARSYAEGGYEVYVDGVIGPWFLKPWQNMAGEGIDVRYIVLRPGEQVTVQRAAEREQRACFPLDAAVVSGLWRMFADLGEFEAHAVDTSFQTVQESAECIAERLRAGEFCLGKN